MSATITVQTFPITYEDSKYFNLFRGFIENKIELLVEDYEDLDNYRIEYRFCEYAVDEESNPNQDDQDATNLFGATIFSYYPDNKGIVEIDLSLISDLFTVSLPSVEGRLLTMSKYFQVQFREVYSVDNVEIEGSWESVHDESLPAFVPFVAIHSGGHTSKLTEYFGVLNNTKRLFKNYTNDIVLFATKDNYSSSFKIQLKYYNKSQGNFLTETKTISTFRGLYRIIPTTTQINAQDTRFLSITNEAGDTVYSNHTIFDATQNENEFMLRWIGLDGDIKSWLFSKTSKFETNVKMNFNEREFRQIPVDSEELIILESDGLSKVEFDFVKDINFSNLVSVTNNSETFECIVSSPQFQDETHSNTKSIKIQIIKKSKYLMSV